MNDMSLQGWRILLAEDDTSGQRLIAHELRRAGARVDFAEDGESAVALLTTTGDTNGPLKSPRPYDIVIMDMQMPVMDGYEATRLLRQKGFDRPIVALTGNTLGSDRDRCIAAGCDEYLAKPCERAVLLETILRVCGKSPALP
jgi:CheY-like chemotaxis protein